MEGGRITVAYAGVHTAFQLALAALEMEELGELLCAAYGADGRWGRRLAPILGHGLMEGRDVAGLAGARVAEFPWPLLAKALRDRIYPRGANHWLAVNAAFDRWAAHRVRARPPALFVGVSTSDLHSLRAARRVGAALLHDVPHLHPIVEAELLREAGERAGLPPPRARRRWRADITDRKLAEMQMADRLLTYSDFHRRTYLQAGFAPERVAVTPLWAEPAAWYRDTPWTPSPDRPLRLLFVGAVSLRKGIPFLLQAVERCGRAVELTIVGPRDPGSQALLARVPDRVSVLPPQPKQMLRATYQAHDVLVLPSVGDAFGYVALEAMACGLPAILSSNCGAPTPRPDWVVPAMDTGALAEHIMRYADDRALACADGRLGQRFAAGFTDMTYRAAVQREFRRMLDPDGLRPQPR